MADIGSWTPPASALGDAHRSVFARLHDTVQGEGFEVTGDDLERVREFMTAAPAVLQEFIRDAGSADLVAWIEVATRAENSPGCDVGDKSPVIPMARLLRDRGEYPSTLTPWIRRHSSNRFLPYGSLMDRL